jgi:hypothetical protein
MEMSNVYRAKKNENPYLRSSIPNVSKSNVHQFIEYSPPFWMIQCDPLMPGKPFVTVSK